MYLSETLNVQVGWKLMDKSKEEIMKEVISVFKTYGVVAVQLLYDTIRVTFKTAQGLEAAKRLDGVRLFGLWCRILGGGPPLTIVHVFDYPFEESAVVVSNAFKDFGEVKKVKDQTSIVDPEICTGTRLVSMVLKTNPPRSLLIGGYLCRVWYKGQPLVCNLCGVQGHKSANCPNRDKCRLCGQSGHFARQCRNAWGGDAANEVVPIAGSGDAPLQEEALPSNTDAFVEEVAADDDEFEDASSESADIGEFSSPTDRLDSQEIMDFSTGSQSILRDVVSHSATGGQSLVHEASVTASNAVVRENVSQSGPTLSQSRVCSGSGRQVASKVSSGCRKRKDRSLPELGRSLSADDLSGSLSKKVFKTPVAPRGRHSRLPVSVNERPSVLPVRASALPVRVRDRPSRT